MDERSTSSTFLFTDIEGSTRLWERFPGPMTGALKRHDTILRQAIEDSAGRVVKTTGDGMMAVFREAAGALTASLAAQRELGQADCPETGPLRVRMGLHTGEADERGGDFFGPTINRTARIMAAGHGGQILLSGATRTRAQDSLPVGASLVDLGEHRLKDIGRPEHLFQLAHPDLIATFPPLAALRPTTADLPARIAELIGRQVELREIGEILDDDRVRLLTLTGPGGTGKTMIAIRVAEDRAPTYPEGSVFVDLSSARDTPSVLVAIARAIGLDDVIERPLQEELAQRLRDRRMLLVLDNLEQVTEAAGAVARLVRDCPRLTVLATSREALHVQAERVYPVPPLGLPPATPGRTTAAGLASFEAVQLFVSRARAVRPDFELTDGNAPAVAEICRRLDGLPLAIELAAARLRLFTPEVLRDRLGDRLGLLRSGPRDLPERQQTLRATMDWSYELLQPDQQRLFEFLSVFADASLSAVEAVAEQVGGPDGDALDPLDGLSSLLEKSLVRRLDVPGSEPRVAMLETIREFAADRLDQRPDFAGRARLAHATYFADIARRSRSELGGNHRERALALLAEESANLRATWGFWVAAGDLGQLDGLASPLMILDDARGWYLNTVAMTTDMLAVLEANPSTPDRVGKEIALRTSLARALMTTRGVTQEVEDAYTSALELFERGADVREQFPVLRGLASLYMFRGQLDKASEFGREILALGERAGDPRMLVDGHLLVGAHEMFMVDLQGGLDHLDQAIALFSGIPIEPGTARVGNDSRVACYTSSGFALWLQGYPERAVERMDAALALARELEHPFTSAYAHFHAGLLRIFLRDWPAALHLADRLLDVADEHGFRVWTATGTCLRGAARVGVGRADEGLGDIRLGVDLYRELRSPPVFWPDLLFLDAGASHGAGRPAEALQAIDAALEFMGPENVMQPEYLVRKGDILAALAAGGGAAGGGAAGAAETGVPSDSPDPEAWYRRAVDHAAGTGARMSQLRAATRLARLLLADGRPEAAAELLGPVHAAFTEGFATVDLQAAQEVLAAAETEHSPTT